MPARERLDLRAGRATASRPGAWAAPGPEPVVRYRLWRSPPPGQFLPAASRARGRWLRHRPRPAAARPAHGTSGDGASRAAVRCRTPASRLTCSGGAAQQTEHLTYPAGPNERRVIPPKKKVASRAQWAGGHLRLPRSVRPAQQAGLKESGRTASPPSCRP